MLACASRLGSSSAVSDRAGTLPVEKLPPASGYDWGFLAFAVGFGGSIIWFGSSAGVAISNMFPDAKSAGTWLRQGWFIAPAYVAGFVVMLAVLGWRAD